MPTPPSRAAAIYTRISLDREGAGLGVARQETECRELAQRLGLDVVTVHSDNDISASSGRKRPGYAALLKDIRSDRVGAVIAWHIDRLHRLPRELEEYITACEQRAVITYTVKAGQLDLTTATGRMQARIVGSVARHEAEQKGERVAAARRQRALAGGYIGGRRVFGYTAKGELAPEEAAAIRAAADAILAGASLRGIAMEWNAAGFRTTFTAQEWNSTTVRRTLLRPHIAGLSVYRGEIVGPGTWQAAVPEDRWRALVSVLTDPSRRTSPAEQRVRWLLSGIALCGVCGEPRLRVTGARNYSVYRCTASMYTKGGNGHVSRVAQPLDDLVSRVIVERLRRPDAADLLRPAAPDGPDIPALHEEANELRVRLDSLAGRFADGLLTLSQLDTGTGRLRERLSRVNEQIAAAEAVNPLVGLVDVPDPGDVWGRLDIGRRRAVVRELLTVTVLRAQLGKRGPNGSRFDPDSITITWKP